MDRLTSVFVGILILYILYFFGFKNWDYTSEAKRHAIRQQIKELGLSTRFHFISAKWLLLLNILSGGLFVFYWSYKQWQAIFIGYKNTSGRTLSAGPLLRALFTPISFYQLVSIVNRTCVYMRKIPAFHAALWGSALLLGLVVACLPMLPVQARLVGAFCFVWAPFILQGHINSLPKELPPFHIRAMEIVWVLLSLVLWFVALLLWKKFN